MAHPRPGGDLRLTACVPDPIVFARSHLRPPTTGARGNRRRHCRSPAWSIRCDPLKWHRQRSPSGRLAAGSRPAVGVVGRT